MSRKHFTLLSRSSHCRFEGVDWTPFKSHDLQALEIYDRRLFSSYIPFVYLTGLSLRQVIRDIDTSVELYNQNIPWAFLVTSPRHLKESISFRLEAVRETVVKNNLTLSGVIYESDECMHSMEHVMLGISVRLSPIPVVAQRFSVAAKMLHIILSTFNYFRCTP